MTMRSGTIGAVIVILVVGFAIGGWLAFVTRPTDGHVTRVTAASTIRTPGPIRATVPATTAPALATQVPAPKPAPTEAPAPSHAPAAGGPTTVTPTAATHVVPPQGVTQGSWELDETNVQVGTIVWAGDTVLAHGNTVVLDVHKQSVGGRPAVPCERQTSLHAEFVSSAAEQSVPYREVNCEGVATTGEMRISSSARNDGSFSGTFWRNGTKLGTFNARKR